MNSTNYLTGSLRRELGQSAWVTIGLIVLALHFLPWVIPNAMHIIIMIYLYTLMSQGWNVLGGYAGQFSFGHALFFGLGAYVSTLLFIHLGLSPWFGLMFSCAAAIVLGLIKSLILLLITYYI